MLVEIPEDQQTEALPVRPAGVQTRTEVEWKKLWNLPCPGKVHRFMWRFANNSLAIRMNARRRGVDVDTLCPVFRRLDDDGGHFILKCKIVNET